MEKVQGGLHFFDGKCVLRAFDRNCSLFVWFVPPLSKIDISKATLSSR